MIEGMLAAKKASVSLKPDANVHVFTSPIRGVGTFFSFLKVASEASRNGNL